MRLALLATSVAAVAVVCAAGASAQAYKAVNRLSVVPLNAADFEVIEARGQGPRGIWCAAADYALHERNVAGAQRIYLKTPRGPSVSGVGRIILVSYYLDY